MFSDCDDARVFGASLWGREDPNLPGCALTPAVCLHKDISMKKNKKNKGTQGKTKKI